MQPEMNPVPLISYSEFIIILLTAITIILVAVGVIFTIASVVLGFLGFIGYKDLIEKAQKRLEDVISKYPKPEVLEAQMLAAIQEAKDNLVASPLETSKDSPASDTMEAGAAPVASAESDVPSGAVSAPYPENKGGEKDERSS